MKGGLFWGGLLIGSRGYCIRKYNTLFEVGVLDPHLQYISSFININVQKMYWDGGELHFDAQNVLNTF